GRCRGQGRQGRRDRQDRRRRRENHRCGRHCRRSRLYRPTHPLRRSDLLGPGDQPVLMARRDLGCDGQLRCRYRAMPARSARDRGITWDWQSFPEFLDAADRRGSALNLAFLTPLTPFRHWVMGEDSMERGAHPEETTKIAALVREAIATGAFGFSMTMLNQHIN